MLDKPYGISCLGYQQTTGGIFVSSRYDQRSINLDTAELLNKVSLNF